MRILIPSLPIAVLLALPLSGCASRSVVESEQERVRDAARRHVEAYRTQDWARVLRRTWPPLVEEMGGHREALAAMEAAAKEADRAYSIVQFTVPPMSEFYFGDDRMFAVVPVALRTLRNNVLVDVTTFQLGILPRGERTWTFVDGGMFPPDRLVEMFPDLPPGARLPRVQSRVRGPATEELLKQYREAAEETRRPPRAGRPAHRR